MKLDITIHVTAGTARRLAWVAASVLVLGAGTAALAVPVTFAGGQKLTAEQLNKNFSDIDTKLNALSTAVAGKADAATSPTVTAWTPYKSSLRTNSEGPVVGQTTTAFYRRVGDSLEVNVLTKFTEAPGSGAQWWMWTLPDGLEADLDKTSDWHYAAAGSGAAEQQNTSNYVSLTAIVRAAGKGTPVKYISATPNVEGVPYVNDNAPFSFRGGDGVALFVSVPIKGWGIQQ